MAKKDAEVPEEPVVDPEEAAAELAAALEELAEPVEEPIEAELVEVVEVAPEVPAEVGAVLDPPACEACGCEDGVCTKVAVDDPRWDLADVPLQSRVPGADPWGNLPLQSRTL
jgi:hypothetical protein